MNAYSNISIYMYVHVSEFAHIQYMYVHVSEVGDVLPIQ